MALEELVKYFFALDKLNYSRMFPLYLTKMSQLERTYPEIWSGFSNGNRAVNENTVPFCAIGLYHALEQINRWMKVTGCLVGITLNENARNRFFLVSANLVQLTEKVKEMTRDLEAARKKPPLAVTGYSEKADKECSKACPHHCRIYKSILLSPK